MPLIGCAEGKGWDPPLITLSPERVLLGCNTETAPATRSTLKQWLFSSILGEAHCPQGYSEGETSSGNPGNRWKELGNSTSTVTRASSWEGAQ